jgi:hypothetical protein
LAQGRVTKATNINGFAIYGAAMLAGFYHRSVLRCGCLAERDPGVEGILTGAGEIGRVIGEKSYPLSRIEQHPGSAASIIRIYGKRTTQRANAS